MDPDQILAPLDPDQRAVATAVAGPVASGAVFLSIALSLHLFLGARFVWNPFGHLDDTGAPTLPGGTLAPGSPADVTVSRNGDSAKAKA